MSHKVALYIDTSIPNALFQEPQQRKEITELFFKEVLPKYDVFVSELVYAEIEATPNERLRNLLLDSIRNFFVLPVSSPAEELAREYIKHLKIPWRDAVHVGISTVEGIDYLVTWNMEHLAKERTRRIVDKVNFLLRLHRLYIVTPSVFFE